MKFKVKTREENGFALPTILLVNLLIITLLLSVIVVLHFIKIQSLKIIEKKRLELACYSGIQMSMVDSTILFTPSSNINIDSFQVTLATSQYGFWREVISSAKGNKDSTKLRCLIGNKPFNESYFNNAVNISRPNLRATVVGETNIIGDILGTSDQIVIGNIFGEPTISKDYHKGTKKVDLHIPPQIINDSLFKIITYKTEKSIYISDEYKQIDMLNIDEYDANCSYSFSKDLRMSGEMKEANKTLTEFYVPGKFEITEKTTIKMNLKVITDSLIVINKNCLIENLLLFSKGPIIIEEGSTFKNVQLFSEDSIHIKSSQFQYPSVICLNVDDTIQTKQNKAIVIENSIINGSVILMTNTAGLSSNKTKIFLDKQSKVQGLVYSENNIELKGEVFGSVYTYNFWYYKEPTEYINWLINIKIDREKLNRWFLLPIVFGTQGKNKILSEEWIY